MMITRWYIAYSANACNVATVIVKSLLIAAALLLGTEAGAIELYVATNGSDVGNCQDRANPCRTGPYAVAQIPLNAPDGYNINFADGTYVGELDIYYQRHVGITGNCNNPAAVVLEPSRAGSDIITSEDHAIVMVSCVMLNSPYASNGGLYARQYAIIDYSNIIFAVLGVYHVTRQHGVGYLHRANYSP